MGKQDGPAEGESHGDTPGFEKQKFWQKLAAWVNCSLLRTRLQLRIAMPLLQSRDHEPGWITYLEKYSRREVRVHLN